MKLTMLVFAVLVTAFIWGVTCPWRLSVDWVALTYPFAIYAGWATADINDDLRDKW